MYRLVVSELAHRDLDNIISYIAVQLVNPMAATNFLDDLEKCYGYLKSNPLMFGTELKHEFLHSLIKSVILAFFESPQTAIYN